MKKIFIAIIFIICLTSRSNAQEMNSSDTIISSKCTIDSLSLTNNNIQNKTNDNSNDWIQRIKKGTYDIKDTTIQYPQFMQFCVNVYNWADRTFNSYDPQYVIGTGRRWKAILRNENWTDSYAFQFSQRVPIRMLSDIYWNVGFYLSYMAVSIGYSFDFGNILANKPTNHKKIDYNFSCALFSIDAFHSENYDGTKIRKFGNYNNGKWYSFDFPELKLKTYGIDAYYFFNNKKYAQGAAYNFSKFQLKSAGSLIAGIGILHNDIEMDFSTLPQEMQQQLPTDQRIYKFNHNDYCLIVGYGHNFVMGKHWLANITVLPAIGFKYSFEDSVDGERDMFSMNYRAKFSFVYNNKDFFCGAIGKADGQWYWNRNYHFFNSLASLSLSFGVRF